MSNMQLVGLANTWISTGYAQISPRSPVRYYLGGNSRASPIGMTWERLTGCHVGASDWLWGTSHTTTLKWYNFKVPPRRHLALWRGQGSQWDGIHDRPDCARSPINRRNIRKLFISTPCLVGCLLGLQLSRRDETMGFVSYSVPNLEFIRINTKSPKVMLELPYTNSGVMLFENRFVLVY